VPIKNGLDTHNEETYQELNDVVQERNDIAKPSTSKVTEPDETDIDINVQKVLDILPHLGDGFIRKLLPRYENVELAIQAIFEDNLPPDLAECDKSEPFIPLDKLDTFYLETGIDRLNIYDGDEFDVRTNETFKGIAKKGKGFPGQPKTIKALLDDKSHVAENKDRYKLYDICDEYDDEYDDSYDALVDSESR
jgi:activating signal cointegrator complex subunit 2